ncbi:glutathione S-transferase C-terminal-like protein [Dacryopinax primogenitus]|uniref:Glutathione S-transferase C-terminal-like protein n=1 Tax=Dacryopinax primogenitus (strain DJM 731) TaxID=1858805 RepID=M5G1R6_DACPD|nr:glutathione S-transferase C-terminal-like protein [Dacryopinax primogenitus]EJT97677.1 glutathione S-transferase C-terminal-like protein [Dacryopinax primogenitus]
MSPHKHITLYTSPFSPNGWKVALVLEELGLKYDSVYLDLFKEEQLAPEFTKLNPNQKVPVLIDHLNDDFVLFESNAIILYLVEQYDPDYKISARGKEKQLVSQWLFSQASGQGPSCWQLFYFHQCSPEKDLKAQERYKDEILRVLSVLNNVLSKQAWLVGGRMTIADISFVPWNIVAFSSLAALGVKVQDEFRSVYRWHTALTARPAVKKVLEITATLQKP